MKRNKIIYWTATGIVGAMMLYGAYNGLTDPKFAEVYKHLGFPDYFRLELATAEIVGALVLLIPQVPARIKEWAYTGFGIVFISATIAHSCNGDPASHTLAPILFFGILAVSNIYFHKTKNTLPPAGE